MPSFTFFDVETPNRCQDRICSIGVIRTDDHGNCEYQEEFLVNPEAGFDPINTSIHGISPSTVYEAPTFLSLWDNNLSDVFSDSVLVAHNAKFDLSVLDKTMSFYSITMPQFEYADTMDLAGRYMGLRMAGLTDLCSALGIPMGVHHNSLDDAEACENIFFSIAARYPVGCCWAPYQPTGAQSNPNSDVLSRAMADLYGIVVGISIDNEIDANEAPSLQHWMEDNSQYRMQNCFSQCFSLLSNILNDGCIEQSERDEILNYARPFVLNSTGTKETVGLQQLLGVLKGISADGEISKEEAAGLSIWLTNAKDAIGETRLYEKLSSSVREILHDSVSNKCQLEELLNLCNEALNPKLQEAAGNACGKTFCLTGEFKMGSRDEVTRQIVNAGGACKEGMSKKVDYVVIGDLGSEAYAYGNYGTKVKKAMELQEKGAPICIIQESALKAMLASIC